VSDMMRDRREVSQFDRQQLSMAQETKRGQGPVNGYEDRSPPISDEEIQPQRSTKKERAPNWQDNDEQPDVERPAARTRQQQFSAVPRSRGRTPDDDVDPYSRGQQDYQSGYGQDAVDRASGGSYEGEPVDDDLITPGSARRNQTGYTNDYDDDPDNPSTHLQQDSAYPNDHSPGEFADGPGRSWYATEQRSDPYSERTVPVMSSSTFGERDEAYLRQRSAYNASARRPQPRSGALSSRARGREEARGLSESISSSPLSSSSPSSFCFEMLV